jgi:hypothetical protein
MSWASTLGWLSTSLLASTVIVRKPELSWAHSVPGTRISLFSLSVAPYPSGLDRPPSSGLPVTCCSGFSGLWSQMDLVLTRYSQFHLQPQKILVIQWVIVETLCLVSSESHQWGLQKEQTFGQAWVPVELRCE